MGKCGGRGENTWQGNVLPVPIVEFDPCGHRFTNQLFLIIGPEGSIAAKQYVGNDAGGTVGVRRHKE